MSKVSPSHCRIFPLLCIRYSDRENIVVRKGYHVSANAKITSSLSGSDLTLSWPDLFDSVHDLYFEVTMGSVYGGGDIMQWQLTKEPNMIVSLASAKSGAFSLSVVVTAIDPCGQFVHYSQNVSVVL